MWHKYWHCVMNMHIKPRGFHARKIQIGHESCQNPTLGPADPGRVVFEQRKTLYSKKTIELLSNNCTRPKQMMKFASNVYFVIFHVFIQFIAITGQIVCVMFYKNLNLLFIDLPHGYYFCPGLCHDQKT